MTDTVSRKLAKARGLKFYFTGKPCSKGHVAERYVSGGPCVECARSSVKDAQVAAKWRNENKSSIAERMCTWRAENKDRLSDQKKVYYRENKEIFYANNAKRRARKLNATALWDLELTALVELEAFDIACQRHKVTGFGWDVDHMLPLRGKDISGLHVWNNLQVIPSTLNSYKKNRMVFTEPGEWLGYV
jgi:hypothetical protein